MTVAELARRAGVTPDTVRHYTRNGLLTPIRDASNGYRNYCADDLARMVFIRKARSLGFSLSDIGDILTESKQGHSPCPQVRKVMDERLQETRRRLADMAKLQKRMEHAVALWANMPDGMPDGHDVCHLIEKIAICD